MSKEAINITSDSATVVFLSKVRRVLRCDCRFHQGCRCVLHCASACVQKRMGTEFPTQLEEMVSVGSKFRVKREAHVFRSLASAYLCRTPLRARARLARCLAAPSQCLS